MLDAVIAELTKLRRSPLWWFLVAGAFLPAVTSTMYFSSFSWPLHGAAALLFLNLSSQILVPSLAGYLVSGEYERRTMNPVLTCPVSRLAVLGAKYVVLAALTAAMYALSAVLAALGGILRSGLLPPAEVTRKTAVAILGLAAIHLAIAPAGILAGLLSRKTVVPVLLGACLVLLYGAFVFTDTGDCIPSCIPTHFVIHVSGVNPYGVFHPFDPEKALAALGAWLAASAGLSLWRFARMEHAGQ